MARNTRSAGRVHRSAAKTPVVKRRMVKEKPMWVLVADGAKANLYSVAPVTFRLTPVPGGAFKQGNQPGHLLVRDKPGRTAGTTGAARHAVGQRTDPHQRVEDAFVVMVADHVNTVAQTRGFDSLIVAAPPKAMAKLRGKWVDAARSRIKLEVTHEWGRLSKPAITARLIELLAGPA